jgi:DNA-binding transcriptional MerR regulator
MNNPSDAKSWSIGQVCKATGLTSRTLRHYDQIGLLPAAKQVAGIRYYNQAQLLQLQQILVYRELGFSLAEISKLQISPSQTSDFFANQKRKLANEIKRLESMLESLELTELRINNQEQIVIEESFEGFDNSQYAEEAEQRWPEQYKLSQQKVAKLSKEQMAAIAAEHEQVCKALAERLISGTNVTDSQVQSLVARHYQWICNFWVPSKEAYVNLGKMYVEDARFAKNYNKHADGLAEFLRDAIAVSGQGS